MRMNIKDTNERSATILSIVSSTPKQQCQSFTDSQNCDLITLGISSIICENRDLFFYSNYLDINLNTFHYSNIPMEEEQQEDFYQKQDKLDFDENLLDEIDEHFDDNEFFDYFDLYNVSNLDCINNECIINTMEIEYMDELQQEIRKENDGQKLTQFEEKDVSQELQELINFFREHMNHENI
jgi:hypothetical protein